MNGCLGQTAVVVDVDGGEPVGSPAGSPGILDQVVADLVVAEHNDSMVQV